MQNGTSAAVLLLGSYAFAEEIADLISETPGMRVVGFVENQDRTRCQEQLLGLPVIWVDELEKRGVGCSLLCTIGSNKRRKFIEQVAPTGLPFSTLIHPTSRVSRTSSVQEGTTLSVNAIVAAHCNIGRHVIINRGASVGHHTEIKEYVTIGPGAIIGGKCVIDAGSYIAMGAVVRDGKRVGSGAVVAAGAVVVSDVPDNVMVAGVPARIIKTSVDGR